MTGVYGIKNRVNGKWYVGSAVDIASRWSVHRFSLRWGNHYNGHLQKSWMKYGEAEFEFNVLELCEVEQLLVREQHWMDQLGAVTQGYNLQPKARSALGFKHSQETKMRLSSMAKKRNATSEYNKALKERAKKQHIEGKLGVQTWTRKPKYNPKSGEAGTRALLAHIKEQSSEEMSRRSYCRRMFRDR